MSNSTIRDTIDFKELVFHPVEFGKNLYNDALELYEDIEAFRNKTLPEDVKRKGYKCAFTPGWFFAVFRDHLLYCSKVL